MAAQNAAAIQYLISSLDLGCSDHNRASESAVPFKITMFKTPCDVLFSTIDERLSFAASVSTIKRAPGAS
jgi:hypothetical protein